MKETGDIEIKFVPANLVEYNEGQIEGVPENYMIRTKEQEAELRKSVEALPEMTVARAAMVFPLNGKYVAIGGNGRVKAQKQLGKELIPVILLPQDTPVEKLRRMAMLDNDIKGTVDWEKVAREWNVNELIEWDVALPESWDKTIGKEEQERKEREEYEKGMREFRKKLESREIDETDEEYLAFVEKFKPKKTTDDCYTPQNIYDTVVDWCISEYKIKRKDIVRPFYPGGDYKHFDYPKGCVVLDNPPFSILAEIMRFYKEKDINFFLFAPTLTLFSSSQDFTAISLGVTVTYENGANVNTSFVTNLNGNVRFRSVPKLYKVIKAENDKNLKEIKKQLPKYTYPINVMTAAALAKLSRYGVEFEAEVSETHRIDGLESQKELGKSIFGSGYLMPDYKAEERAEAEQKAEERAEAEERKGIVATHEWELTENEKTIIRELKK